MNLTSWFPERRVRKVHLQAPTEALFHRGRILLEDALQTASIPGEQSGRLLLIRRLDVGRISGLASATHLSRTIEEKFLQPGIQIIYADSTSAGTSPIVFFADQIDALVCLAVRLVHGPPPREWFWELAVPVWRADLALPAMLRILLAAAFSTPLSTTGGVIFLQELLNRSSLDAVLRTISARDGAELLQVCGWRIPDHTPPAGVSATPELQFGWRQQVLHWVTTWGRLDPRSIFLTAVAIAAGNPSRLSAPMELLDAAAQWLRPQMIDTAWIAAQDQRSLFESQIHDAMSLRSQRADLHSVREADNRKKIGVEQEKEFLVADSTAWRGETTEFAGFYFLLPILVRLDLPSVAVSNPSLLELELPKRILLRIAERLGMSASDPALLALETVPRKTADEIPDLNFVAPRAWLNKVCRPHHSRRPWQIRRQAGQSGRRVLSDSTGRLVLACWTQPAPTVLKELFQPFDGGLGVFYIREKSPPADDLTMMVDAWVLSIRRLLRREAGMALGELVRRPGHVFFSRTHIDITLPLQNADLRIRKAGLDMDPGWLPWLGRVVYFHYE